MGMNDRMEHWLCDGSKINELMYGMEVKIDIEDLIRKARERESIASYRLTNALTNLTACRLEEGANNLFYACCLFSEHRELDDLFDETLVTLKKVRVFMKSLIE